MHVQNSCDQKLLLQENPAEESGYYMQTLPRKVAPAGKPVLGKLPLHENPSQKVYFARKSHTMGISRRSLAVAYKRQRKYVTECFLQIATHTYSVMNLD